MNNSTNCDQFGPDSDSTNFHETSHVGVVRDSEEMVVELRRENFRLRLLCYDYEKAFERSTKPQNADSSRLFAAETKNITLRDDLAEKDALLNYVSKYLDELKQANLSYEDQIKDLMCKMDFKELEWREKYERLCSEYEKAKKIIQIQETDNLHHKSEVVHLENEYESRIIELEDTVPGIAAGQCSAGFRDICKHLTQQVSQLMTELECQVSVKNELTGELEKLREQVRLLEWEKKEDHNQLIRDLSDKQLEINRLRRALDIVSSTAEVTQISLPDDLRHSMPSLLLNVSHVGGVVDKETPLINSSIADQSRHSMQKLLPLARLLANHSVNHCDLRQIVDANSVRDPDQDQSARRRHQSATFSIPGDELLDKTAPVISSGDGLEDIGCLPQDIEGLQKELTHVRKQLTQQMHEFCQLRKAYDALAGTSTHVGLLNSELSASVAADTTNGLSLSSTGDHPIFSVGASVAISASVVLRDTLPSVSTPPQLPSSSCLSAASPPLNQVAAPITGVDNAESDDLTHAQPSIQPERQHMLCFSGLLNAITVTPLNQSPESSPTPIARGDWSEVSDAIQQDNKVLDTAVTATPIETPVVLSFQKPSGGIDSLAPLRSLHHIVLSLRRHLDNVTFTQHSFVEMINRSLSTAGIDASFQLSPNKMQSFSHSYRDISQVDLLKPVVLTQQPTVSEKSISRANATYGGVDTLFENLGSDAADDDRFEPYPAGNDSINGLNLTVAELRKGFPCSPKVQREHRSLSRIDWSPVPKIIRPNTSAAGHSLVHSDNTAGLHPSPIFNDGVEAAVDNDNQSCTASVLLGNTSSRACLVPTQGGDVTMMEWEHRDLFERLLSAMSRLRDAIQDCSDVDSELWSGGANKCLSFLLGTTTNQAMKDQKFYSDQQPVEANFATNCSDEISRQRAARTNLSTSLTGAVDKDFRHQRRNPAVLEASGWMSVTDMQQALNSSVPPADLLAPNQVSAHFDAPCQNANMSEEEISLSQLYGSAWRNASRCQNKMCHNMEANDYNQTLALLELEFPTTVETADLILKPHVMALLSKLTDWEDRYNTCLKECHCLQSRLEKSVPLDDYKQLSEHVDRLTSDLSVSQRLVDQEATLRARLREIDLPVDEQSLLDCLNVVLSELAHLRPLKHQEQQWVEANECLRQKVTAQNNSLKDTQESLSSLQQLIESSKHTLAGTLNTTSNLASSFDLIDLVQIVTDELMIRRCELDELADDYGSLRSTIAYLLDCSLSDDIGEANQLVETKITGLLQELKYYQGEVEQSVDAIQSSPANVDRLDSGGLSDCVTVLLEGLVAKQKELDNLNLQFTDVRDGLTEAVATITERDSQIVELKAYADHLCESTVSSDQYHVTLNHLTAVEQQLRDASTILNRLVSPPEAGEGNLIDHLTALATEFDNRKLYTTRVESDHKAVVDENQLLADQVSEFVELKAESDKRYSDLTRRLHDAHLLIAKLVTERDSLSFQLSEKETELNNAFESKREEVFHLQELLSCMTGQMDVTENDEIHPRPELLAIATETVSVCKENIDVQTSIITTQEVGCEVENHNEPNTIVNTAPVLEDLVTNQPSSRLDYPEWNHGQGKILDVVKPISSEATFGPLTPDQTNTTVRLRKYQELKTLAFELKDKLISRTDKLDLALKEVVRLRSVIQQDKERASRVLDEVEDLRNQVLTKNKKIQILEGNLQRIKASSNIDRSPYSAARTVSELEQPRGAALDATSLVQLPVSVSTAAPIGTSIWPSVSEYYPHSVEVTSCNSSGAGTVGGALASLAFNRHSRTPNVDDIVGSATRQPAKGVANLEQQDITLNILDSSSLIFSPVSLASSNPSIQVADTQIGQASNCDRCHRLSDLIVRLKGLVGDLRNGVKVDLAEEKSLLTALDSADQCDQEDQDAAGAISESPVKVNSNNRTTFGRTQLSTSHLLSTEVKENIKSLKHARTRLRHYANEMERVCTEVVLSCRSSAPLNVSASDSIPDGCRVAIERSVRLLRRIVRKVRPLSSKFENSESLIIDEVLRDLKNVLSILCMVNSTQTTSGNKENEPSGPASAGVGHYHKKHLREGNGSVGHNNQSSAAGNSCHRRYLDLVRGLDKLTQDLSDTTEVLVGARTNLEHTTSALHSPPTRQKAQS